MLSIILQVAAAQVQSAASAIPPQNNNTYILTGLLVNIGSIAAIITLIIVVYKIGVWIQLHVGKIDHLEKDSAGNIKPSIDKLYGKIEDKLLPQINDINTGVSYIRGIIERRAYENITETHSPVVLNEKGKKILENSGINKIVIENYSSILAKVRAKNPLNAYQAQEEIKVVVKELANSPARPQIETGAFNSGSDVDTVLFVGALDIRDRMLKDLGLAVEDIDKYTPPQNHKMNN